jgi:hypothetical protein
VPATARRLRLLPINQSHRPLIDRQS